MANPTVDKLKVFGIRHGEKVAMGVVAVIFAMCSYFALKHDSVDTTPDEVKKTASLAQANLNNSPKKEQIAEKLEADGVKLAGFEKKVEAMQAGVADASQFALANTFVKPEPGAGLIRDMPELISPTQIYVHAGRGAVRVLALNDDGEPIPKEEGAEKKAPRPKARPKSRGTAGRMGGGMMGGMGGGRSSKTKKNSGALAEAQAKKDEEKKAEITSKGIAGREEAAKNLAESKKDEETPLPSAADYETELNGYRFVTIVGKLDHKTLKERYSKALKVDLASANPNYLHLDVERQEVSSDGSWSDWSLVSRKPYEELRKINTDFEKEMVAPESLISTLVDPLPFLEVGYWVGAHHGALLTEEKLLAQEKSADAAAKSAKAASPKGNRMPMGGMQMGAADYAKGGMGGGMSPGGGDYAAAMKGRMGMGGMPQLGSDGGGGGSGPREGDFQKSSADWIMVRALDCSVDPDMTYRYRVRIVVGNPNYHRDDVSPGVDTNTKELAGPWSAVTAEANVPADVSTYTLGMATPGPKTRPDQVKFQVASFNPDDGLTVIHTFEQAPGEIIGSKYSTTVPNDDKTKLVNKEYDYTSRQILADALGGDRPASEIQSLGASRFEAPALALVVRPDGLLVVRDQAADTNNGERDELKDIYETIKKDVASGKKKSSSSMMGLYGGGMGGYGAMGGRGGGGTTGAQ